MQLLNNNSLFFFELVRAGLWEKEAQLSQYGNIDFNEILRLSGQQSVVGLVAAGIEHVVDVKLPQGVSLQFVGQAIQLEQRNSAMNSFISFLVEKMRHEDIYTLIVKGQGVAQCYGRPLWRASGDVDLFLSDGNFENAKNFLLPLASKVDTEYEGIRHLGMTIDGWKVELHGSLRVGLSKRINRELDDIYNDAFYCGNVRSWDNNGTKILMLGRENDIVYVFVHFFNHFYNEGVGLRQICDWCRLLWTYRSEINFEKIESRIRKMGFVSEWKTLGAYAVEYLGMPTEALPMYDSSSKWVKKAHLINEFMMKVGNMRHNRDMSHFCKKPYFIRKCVSMGRRIGDLINHARIFPLDSLRFFPRIMFNGVRSAMRGK